jgi:signal transduction histidine kinase
VAADRGEGLGRPVDRPEGPRLGLAAVLLLVVMAFVAATAMAVHRGARMSVDAAWLSDSALPSIERLLDAREALARLETQIVQSVFTPDVDGLRWVGREVPQHQQRLRAAVDDYLALPPYPDERLVADSLRRDAERSLASLRRVERVLAVGDRPAAQREVIQRLWPALIELRESLIEAESLNAAYVRTFIERMEATRHAATVTLVGLNALAVVLALGLAAAAHRAAGRTERLRQERARLLVERSTELEMFAARVAHDILSPLTAVSLPLERAARSDEERVRKGAERGLQSLARVRLLVDDLLTFARSGARPAAGQATALGPVLRDVTAGLEAEAARAAVTLHLVPSPAELMVAASRGVVTSVLSNLLRNAIKYMGDSPVRQVTIRSCPRNGRARVEVEDTGPGLEPRHAARVFEPYVRYGPAQAGSLGLGLATVKRLVEAHEGAVGVRPGQDRGTVFWFELPLRPAPPLADGP